MPCGPVSGSKHASSASRTLSRTSMLGSSRKSLKRASKPSVRSRLALSLCPVVLLSVRLAAWCSGKPYYDDRARHADRGSRHTRRQQLLLRAMDLSDSQISAEIRDMTALLSLPYVAEHLSASPSCSSEQLDAPLYPLQCCRPGTSPARQARVLDCVELPR